MSSASPSPSIEHPALGQVRGTKPPRHPHVDQYLGLQYATLASRFARGTLVEPSATSRVVDATKTGPLPVADPENCAREHLLLQHGLPFGDFQFSDTECLTLNVSVPATTSPAAASLLPVVAFVHGGGFVTGSANWPQYDLAPLVERSVHVGKPVIAVGINYRLGPFGFLNSAALRDAGFLPNNGLHDQKLALRWIQQHIRPFGGDPARVTFLGSSMGAASGFVHLQSDEPLFASLVALGGNPLIQPLPLPVADAAFAGATAALGLADRPPAEQVQALLALPAETLAAKLAAVPLPLNAYHDGDVVKSVPSYASLARPADFAALFPGAGTWCKTALLGDSQQDGMVMDVTVLSHRPDNLHKTLVQSLAAVFGADSDALVTPVTKAYGIDPSAWPQGGDKKPDQKDKLPVIHFINDVLFAQGAKATARAWSAAAENNTEQKAFLWHFNLPNPWDGPWKGHASHALDIVILLGTYNAFLSPGQKACAEQLADDFLSLAHGQAPFPPLQSSSSGGEVAKVYYAAVDGQEDESKVVVLGQGAEASQATRRRAVLEEVAAGNPGVLDKFLAAFGLFMQGGPK